MAAPAYSSWEIIIVDSVVSLSISGVLSVWLFLGKFSNIACHYGNLTSSVIKGNTNVLCRNRLRVGDYKARGSGFKPWGNYIHC